ncbi:MAG TPA: UDP-N-acetylmuramoyl-tripeptide--D-alanyl-D-alanine ligase, partial [Planctomycetota bacterium]|nr:UDP-N-acetylmuramoyl-tripeptide--D-alanyl-D-alanine ligase [Planctomycetota bacterium]
VPAVLANGAAAAVVDHTVQTSDTGQAETSAQLVVSDTQKALRQLASFARRRWAGRVVGVTGSAGKTTTKEIIAHLLSAEFPTGRTIGNLNNEIGLPLSILRLPDASKVAVLEMGMNHAGEICRLAAIARPDVGVVTNVGYAHAGFFKSIEGIAAAKRELIEGLQPDGVAVLNADDPLVSKFAEVHPGRSITFGFSETADIRGEMLESRNGRTRFRAAGCEFDTSLAGRHSVLNFLAGIAVAQVFEIPPQRLIEPVRSFTMTGMRGERFEHQGIVVWNDCYNSNPEAARSMIDVLVETPAARRIAVLGEMLELGHEAPRLHAETGAYAARRGIHVLVGVRGHAREMIDAAVAAGMSAATAQFFEEPAPAGEFVKQAAAQGDAVLFKGSRGVRMEIALERFLA